MPLFWLGYVLLAYWGTSRAISYTKKILGVRYSSFLSISRLEILALALLSALYGAFNSIGLSIFIVLAGFSALIDSRTKFLFPEISAAMLMLALVSAFFEPSLELIVAISLYAAFSVALPLTKLRSLGGGDLFYATALASQIPLVKWYEFSAVGMDFKMPVLMWAVFLVISLFISMCVHKIRRSRKTPLGPGLFAGFLLVMIVAH